MAAGKRIRVLTVVMCCVAATITNASETARIIDVAFSAYRLPTDQVWLHLPKFHDDLWLEAGEEIVVEWAPRAGGSEIGTTVRFRYLQQRQPEIQTLEVTYPFRVTDPRTANFSVTGSVFEQWGNVTAWQVQVLEGGTVVAEQRSKTWP